MSTHPYDALLHELTAATEDFLRSLEGVAPERWQFKPAPEVWSVAEAAEHTAVVFRGSERLLTTRLLGMPMPAEPGERISDTQIVQAMFDRTRPMTAPVTVLPKGRWSSVEELRTAFVTSRNTLASWLREQTVDLRGFGAPHPAMGLLDGVQWLLFTAAHTERHTRQIVELRHKHGF
jgi:DinB superfamily